jgi:hypothetical protein
LAAQGCLAKPSCDVCTKFVGKFKEVMPPRFLSITPISVFGIANFCSFPFGSSVAAAAARTLSFATPTLALSLAPLLAARIAVHDA